jgi:hypothetical protein
MISDWLSAALARRNIHYGWAMVGVTFLTALISAGTVGAPGVSSCRCSRNSAGPPRKFLGAVDPLHPVRADGAVRRRLAEPLRLRNCHAVGVADRGFGTVDFRSP